MKTTELNVLRMAEAVLEVLNLYEAKLGSAPKLLQLKNELKALVDSYHKQSQQLALENNFATVKQEKRTSVIQAADEIVNKIQLYAAMEKDSLTKAKVNLYYADLHNVGGDKLSDTCNEIHKLAETLGTKLADYNVLPATLTTFKSQLTDFIGLLSAPRMDIAARAAINKEISRIIADIRELLNEKMDKSMNSVKNTETAFFAAYTSSRVIVDKSGKRAAHSTAADTGGMISGTLTDTATGEPLADVVVLRSGSDEPATTDEDGSFMFDSVAAGTYTLSCSLDGYNNLTLSGILVTPGNETETEGSMDKA